MSIASFLLERSECSHELFICHNLVLISVKATVKELHVLFTGVHVCRFQEVAHVIPYDIAFLVFVYDVESKVWLNTELIEHSLPNKLDRDLNINVRPKEVLDALSRRPCEVLICLSLISVEPATRVDNRLVFLLCWDEAIADL